MKPPKIYYPLLIALFILGACEFQEDPGKTEDPLSLKVTGVNQVISYTIENENGRILDDSAATDEVEMVTLLILDDEGNIVHEKWYHNYYDGTIPDTITIPSLEPGDYELVAATTEFYYYYYHENDTSESRPLVLPSWAYSHYPIFVGYEAFSLNEDGQVVEIDMTNISARINLKLSEGQSMNEEYLEVGFRAEDAYSYRFDTDEMVMIEDYNYGGAYTWIDEWNQESSVYVMPQTITGFGINYYSYHGDHFYQEIDLAETIKLETADAITFTFDLEKYLKGAGQGVFNFEDIDWNDRGEVSIP